MPIQTTAVIEQTRYSEGFYLGEDRTTNYQMLPPTEQAEAQGSRFVKVRDNHGVVSTLDWGTVVTLLRPRVECQKCYHPHAEGDARCGHCGVWFVPAGRRPVTPKCGQYVSRDGVLLGIIHHWTVSADGAEGASVRLLTPGPRPRVKVGTMEFAASHVFLHQVDYDLYTYSDKAPDELVG